LKKFILLGIVPCSPLTWWGGLCLFDVKKADQRQSEIK
jgi:hypothetical protein